MVLLGVAFLVFVGCLAAIYHSLEPQNVVPIYSEQSSDSDILHRDAGRSYETTLGTRSN